MSSEKINIVLPEGSTEVVIREGAAIKVLDPKAPVKIDLKGVIQAPFIFLSKRHDLLDYSTNQVSKIQLDLTRTHILVNREKVTITLIMNENDDYIRGQVLGQLQLNPKFNEFGINSEKQWEPNKLGQFFKMNRAYFSDKAANMNLVSQLKTFKANVNAQISKTKSDSGTFDDSYSATVESNLPGTFKVNMPLFKGFPPEEIEVEFYASVDGRDFTVQLVSPGAQQAYDEIRDSIIDDQLKLIADLCPMIPIIEQ